MFWQTPLLLPLIVALLYRQSQAAAATPSPHIISINGTAQFSSLISRDTHTFVKFFHPECGHCIALAPHFATLAAQVDAHNSQPGLPPKDHVTVAEVDAAREKNSALIDAHADAFPTLKLFLSGRLLSEYDGPRRPEQMLAYVEAALRFRSAPLVEQIATRADLFAFLQEAAHRPVVLSVFHDTYDPARVYPPHVRPCPEAWRAAVARLRNGSARHVAFGAVADASLLVPLRGASDKRFRRVKRVPFTPALAAAPSGAGFWKDATWWFPGLHGADSMETFMHLTVVREKGYVVLDTYNAHHLLSSVRPLALVFGEAARPSWQDRYFLSEAARQAVEPRLVPLYVHTTTYAAFAEHVGLVGEGTLNETKGNSAYLLYREAASRPAVARFVPGAGKGSTEWLEEQAKEVNRSNMAIPPGEVLDLDRDSWYHLFEYDGRGVLLELYRSDCTSCVSFQATYQKVATMLGPHAGSVVVAKFDLEKHLLPVSPELPQYKYVPTMIYIPPGGKAVKFEGLHAARPIAKFARSQAEAEEVSFDGLSFAEVAAGYLFSSGLFFAVSGLVISSRAQKRHHHVT